MCLPCAPLFLFNFQFFFISGWQVSIFERGKGCNPIDPTFHQLLHSDNYLLLSEIYLPAIFPCILLHNQARTSLYEDHLLSFFLPFHIITHVYTSLKKIPWSFAVSLCDPVLGIACFTGGIGKEMEKRGQNSCPSSIPSDLRPKNCGWFINSLRMGYFRLFYIVAILRALGCRCQVWISYFGCGCHTY